MTFRPMRRIRQLMSDADTKEILARGEWGVLAVSGDEGYPYAVPVNYLYAENKIIIHGANSGHKIDAVRRCNKASFCVTDKATLDPDTYSTFFRSAIVFGKVHVVEDECERDRLCELLAERFRPGHPDDARVVVERDKNTLAIIVLEIEYLTGKEAIELVRARK